MKININIESTIYVNIHDYAFMFMDTCTDRHIFEFVHFGMYIYFLFRILYVYTQMCTRDIILQENFLSYSLGEFATPYAWIFMPKSLQFANINNDLKPNIINQCNSPYIRHTPCKMQSPLLRTGKPALVRVLVNADLPSPHPHALLNSDWLHLLAGRGERCVCVCVVGKCLCI